MKRRFETAVSFLYSVSLLLICLTILMIETGMKTAKTAMLIHEGSKSKYDSSDGNSQTIKKHNVIMLTVQETMSVLFFISINSMPTANASTARNKLDIFM